MLRKGSGSQPGLAADSPRSALVVSEVWKKDRIAFFDALKWIESVAFLVDILFVSGDIFE